MIIRHMCLPTPSLFLLPPLPSSANQKWKGSACSSLFMRTNKHPLLFHFLQTNNTPFCFTSCRPTTPPSVSLPAYQKSLSLFSTFPAYPPPPFLHLPSVPKNIFPLLHLPSIPKSTLPLSLHLPSVPKTHAFSSYQKNTPPFYPPSLRT